MKAASALVSALLLLGCASEVYRVRTTFTASPPGDTAVLVLERDVTVTPKSGAEVTLKAGSTWARVGRVPQGAVYAIKNDVFSVSGRNNHEAQAVVTDGGMLVGFFLPVEHAFTPVGRRVQLPIRSR